MGRNMVFRKSSFGWVQITCPTLLLVDQGSPGFFAERGRNRCRHISFPILDISTSSGDIRDRSLKLSEVDPNFARFWSPFFSRECPQILGPGL